MAITSAVFYKCEEGTLRKVCTGTDTGNLSFVQNQTRAKIALLEADAAMPVTAVLTLIMGGQSHG